MRMLLLWRAEAYKWASSCLLDMSDWCKAKADLLNARAKARCPRQGNLFTDGRG
jgi:hypothetical protein